MTSVQGDQIATDAPIADNVNAEQNVGDGYEAVGAACGYHLETRATQSGSNWIGRLRARKKSAASGESQEPEYSPSEDG
ncbi:unnamed protein product [Dibothriocephalus latus]|uniref:Uncharacterized protein n=1 Tax=Dibothriocephalus latus TaxID=60516 RepID=A0A3P7LFJ2_DIBLA|nr:unnamed protein product [Dibothriocephalus latus]